MYGVLELHALRLSGDNPYENDPRNTLLGEILEGLRPTLPVHCSGYLAFCIRECWELEPENRPKFSSICRLLRRAKCLSLGLASLDDITLFLNKRWVREEMEQRCRYNVYHLLQGQKCINTTNDFVDRRSCRPL